MTDFMRDEFGAPKVVDRATFQAELDTLRVREKAHTHEGDAIAAARRRLPMVEVDGATPLIGERGAVTLLDAFEGRRMLIAYYFMWHTGHPFTLIFGLQIRHGSKIGDAPSSVEDCHKRFPGTGATRSQTAPDPLEKLHDLLRRPRHDGSEIDRKQ
jgi:hypothetical protein